MEMHGGVGQGRGGRRMECTCKERWSAGAPSFDETSGGTLMCPLLTMRQRHVSICGTSTQAEVGRLRARSRDTDSVRVTARAAGEQEMRWVRRG